jgi:hypothetical protein
MSTITDLASARRQSQALSGGGSPQPYDMPTVTQSPGFGGGPTGGAGDGQQSALLNPPPLTANTPVNPLQQQGFDNTQSAFNRAGSYADQFGSLANTANTNALSSARDVISGMTKEAEQGGIQRGGVGSGLSQLLRSNMLNQGTRSLHKLGGELTDAANMRQIDANRAVADAAGGTASAANMAAGQQNALQLGSWAAQNAAQQTLIAQAAAQARLNEDPYNRLMSMMDSISRNRGSYGSLGGGLGVLGGGTPGGLGGFGSSSSYNPNQRSGSYGGLG